MPPCSRSSPSPPEDATSTPAGNGSHGLPLTENVSLPPPRSTTIRCGHGQYAIESPEARVHCGGMASSPLVLQESSPCDGPTLTWSAAASPVNVIVVPS